MIERERFEAWARQRWTHPEDFDQRIKAPSKYNNYEVQAAWDAWQERAAQPAPSINEGVRKVTLGFRWEGEAQHHIPTIKIEFDPVSPDSPNDAKGWQDRDRIASMLSPEAKP